MNRAELAQTIKVAFDEKIRPILCKSGYGDFTIRPNPKGDKEKLEQTMYWIDNLLKNEIKNLKDAYELVPEHWWEGYKIFGNELDDLAESKILKQALKEFRSVWMKRPSILRRTYYE